MREFFRPTIAKLAVFSALALIAVVGSLQASGFGGREEAFLPAVPFWTIWMFLLVPMAIVGQPVLRAPAPLFWGAQVLYFYLLACAATALRRRLLRIDR